MNRSCSPILRKCWANGADCRGALTKEHVISASILRFLGPLRLKKQKKTYTLGVGSYVVRNLCEYHNGRLSPYDAESALLYECLDALAREKTHRLINRNEHGQLVVKLSGRAIERWFAKTFINSAIFEASAIREQPPTFELSSHAVIEQLFKDKDFVPPFGLRTAKPGIRISSNYRPGMHAGLTYASIRHHNMARGWQERSIPVYYYISIHGLELLGFFNSTSFSDDFALAHWLEKYRLFVEEKTIPLPFQFGFSLPGEKDLGALGPARIIDLADGVV